MVRFKRNEIRIVLLSALILFGFFILPKSANAELTLPATSCDWKPRGFQTTGMTLEDGTKAFTYGHSNNNFVSIEDDKYVIRFKLKFTPAPDAQIRLSAIHGNADCAYVNGFGPVHYDVLVPMGENTIVYDPITKDTTLNGVQTMPSFPSLAMTFIWMEVWDGNPNSNFATYSYLIDLRDPQNPTGSIESPPPPKRPVLIIPGIMGSELYEGDDFIWPSLSAIVTSPSDNFLSESLALDQNGNSVNNIIVGQVLEKSGIEPLVTDIFDSLINNLVENDYSLDNDFFLFPYDWRLDLDETKNILNEEIEDIKAQTGQDKVDIIAHSMGGLLAKNYIHEFGSDSVNKLVFVGTPHLGAPKAAYSLLQGDIGVPVRFLNFEAIRDISINSPATYQLLPNQLYHQNAEGYFKTRNGDILSFQESNTLLNDQGKNQILIDRAEEFFNKGLSEIDLSGIEVYNIAGCNKSTQAIYHIDDSGNIYSISYLNGDGTVPLVSSQYQNSSFKYYVRNAGHAELPSLENVRDLIVHILNNEDFTASNISEGPGICNLKGKKLTWRSPVEIHIYDASDNHAGPTADDFENNIPGVQYDIINGEKFIFLPTDEGQEYRIEAIGEETGTFDLLVTDFDGIEGNTQLFDNVEIVPNSFISFSVSDSSGDSEINYDFDNNGSSDLINAVNFDSEEDAFTVAMTPESSSSGGGGGGSYSPAPIIPAPEDTKNEESGNILGEAIIRIPDGTLVLDTSDGRTVYMIGSSGKKYGFTSAVAFLGQGFKFENIISGDLSGYELGGLISDPQEAHPNGSLITDGKTIWRIYEEKRFEFTEYELKNLVKANKNDLLLEIKIIN